MSETAIELKDMKATDSNCQTKSRRTLIIAAGIFVLALLAFLPFLGAFKLLDPSDGWYSESAREMVARGDYFTTYLNFVPWFDKPIMNFWLICCSYKLFGVSELAARLPAALSAVLVTVGTFLFSRRYMSMRASILASLILLGSPLFCIVGHLTMTDMPLTVFLEAAFASGFACVFGKSRFAWLAFYVACAGALLTKGPIGLALPLVIVGAYLVWTSKSLGEFWQGLGKLQIVPGVLLAIAMASPWYIYEHFATNGGFTKVFFIDQNLRRATGHLDHLMPAWFYIPIFLGGFFPWSILLFAYGMLAQKLAFRRFTNSPQTRLMIFSLIAGVVVIALFMVVPSKLPTYILPAWPPLAVFVAGLLDFALRAKSEKPLVATATISMIVALCGVAGAICATGAISNLFIAAIVCAALVSCFMIAACDSAYRGNVRKAVVALVLGTVTSCIVIVPLGLWLYSTVYQKCEYDLVDYAKQNNLQIALFGRNSPGYLFYYRKPMPVLHFFEDAAKYVVDHGSCVIMSRTDRIPLLSRFGCTVNVLKQEGDWCLMQVSRPPIK